MLKIIDFLVMTKLSIVFACEMAIDVHKYLAEERAAV